MEFSARPAIALRGISKAFPGVLANSDVTLSVGEGEVRALLGENGAGKSTLVKILYGLYQPDSGSIEVGGRTVSIRSPRDAMSLGIGMIHQHFTLVPVHSVWENVVLGLSPADGRPLSRDAASAEIAALGKKYGLEVDPYARIDQLSVGMQQKVEILKALYRRARILVLDEPTAVLTPGEAENLFSFLREFRASGNTVLFITHKLAEVFAVADSVTVLRGGRNAGDFLVRDASESDLVTCMVGRELLLTEGKPADSPGSVVLDVRSLSIRGDRGNRVVEGLSLSVAEGEILGIAGVSGNGQEELADVLCGLRVPESGEVLLDGRPIRLGIPEAAFLAGTGYIPADRHREGLVLDMTVEENLILKNLSAYSRFGFLCMKKMRENAERLIKQFGIMTPSPSAKVKGLSGGNQQKIVAAREIEAGNRLLVAVQPTRGLDLGAADHVHRTLLDERDRGKAVFLVSTELSEVLKLSDRIAVIFRGRILGEFKRSEATVEKIGMLLAGGIGDAA